MIEIQTTPPEVFFAGNPVQYKINSDNLLSYIGRKCSFTLVVYKAYTEPGQTISFEFTDRTLLFTTVESPDDSGLQIPKSVSGLVEFTLDLLACFRSNFDLSSRFVITYNAEHHPNAIAFEAVNTGSLNSVNVTAILENIDIQDYNAGIDSVCRQSFSVIAGIWDRNFQQLAQDVKPVDALGNVVFNFSEYLSALLECITLPRFTFPFDPTQNLKSFEYCLPYYAGFAERFEGRVQKIHFDMLRKAFAGGLNRETLVYYNSKNLNFFEVEENKYSFMTWAPVQKITGKTVPEKLFFKVQHNTLGDTIVLNVLVRFSDNTSVLLESEGFGIVSDQVIECSVGYKQLNFENLYPGETIASWEIWLRDQGGLPISERRIFILDPIVYENERIFIFQNSFGKAYDVVRFNGLAVESLNLDFVTGNSENLDNYSQFNAPEKRFSASETVKMKINSGWLSREMKDYLREMLLSREIFEYKNGLLYALVITTDKMKEHFVDNEYLYSLELEYECAYRDYFFSKITTPQLVFHVDYSDDYSDDYD